MFFEIEKTARKGKYSKEGKEGVTKHLYSTYENRMVRETEILVSNCKRY